MIAFLLWIGAGLSFPVVADVRRSLAAGPSQAAALRERLKTTSMIVIPSAIITLVTGLLLINFRGGFGVVPVRIHVGLLCALLVFAIGAGFTSPAMMRFGQALEKGELPEAGAAADRLILGLRLEDGLRLLALLSMLIPLENFS
ncbi:MAG: hypothetical protein IPG45_13190 [Deltaproteobacteria bacterium]|nr:hypothetical protein [Deltaproteobacteria bacterium]